VGAKFSYVRDMSVTDNYAIVDRSVTRLVLDLLAHEPPDITDGSVNGQYEDRASAASTAARRHHLAIPFAPG
jgi:hypothetical protein